jgi:site-specific DNA recombinase
VRLEGQRVAVYARYSTDKQNPRSIDDQVRMCRERVEQLGGTVAYVFEDAAISGSIAKRPGLEGLMRAVRDKRVEAVITEDFSRLGRDQVDTLTLVKQFRTIGARLIALDGFDSGGDAKSAMVMSTIKSMMGELYLDELRERTRRGMRGLFEGGFHTGGRVYGYASVDAGDGSGRKRLAIDDKEAAVVRRIFAAHVAGTPQRTIAVALNADRIASARGGRWSNVVVRELLKNEIYTGAIIFGRRLWKRDETGKRTCIERPKSEWRRTQHDELRIIDADLWHAAQGRADHVRRQHLRGARPKRGYPLSGLLECGKCGALLTVAGNGRYYACGSHHKGHGCDNVINLRESAVRAWLCDQIGDTIGSPTVLADLRSGFAKSVGDHDRKLKAEITDRRQTLGRIEAELARLYDFVAEGNATAGTRRALKEREDHAELQRAAIVALEQRLGRVPVLPSTSAINDFLRRLPDVLDRRPDAGRELLGRMLGGRAVCTPPRSRAGHYHVRAELRPSEVLAYTASVVAGTVYSSVSCGGAVFTLGYAQNPVILEGEVPRDYGRRP